ncbi:hypothetical protein ACFL4T_09430 [candidate division KSB1 bacterium]
MKTYKIIAVILFVVFLITDSAFAKIPAFARKYGYSCKTCHNPFPRLKAYGNDFAAAGFKEKEEPRSAYKDSGDDKLTLMRDLPLSLRMDVYFQYNSGSEVKTDLKTPYILKLLSGGHIAPNIGYYLYFFFSERGEVAGIEDAFLHFSNLFGTGLDVIAGQFQVSDPLLKRELRLTYEDYMLYKIKPGFSNANLTYDRGLVFTYGLPSHTDLTFQILNGNGKPEADEEHNFDTDSEKAFAFRVSQEAKFFRVGGFYYYAKETLNSRKNTVKWYGPDITVGNDVFNFEYQYLIRKDNNPWFLSNPLNNEIKSQVAEFTYKPKGDESDWYSVLLYNKIQNEYESFTANYIYMVRRNVKFLVEFTRDIQFKKNRLIVGLISGF